MNSRISPLFGCRVKTCTCCGNDYPLTREYWSPDHGSRLSPRCKRCRAEKSRNWYMRKGRAERKERRSCV